MDGRRPTGILYVNTHVDDPSKEDEYHRWYRDVHFGDVTESGLFVNAEMFHNAQSPLPPAEGKFLAFYECYAEDVLGAALAFSRKTVDVLFAERRIHAGTASRLFGVYQTRTLHFATSRRRRSQSLIAVHVDARSPAQSPQLCDWYVRQHVPEVTDLGLCHTGGFYERLDPEPFRGVTPADQPRFLALYESDIGDPRAIAAMLAEKFPADQLPPFVQLRFASFFYRAGP
jgi:hypothetical protein